MKVSLLIQFKLSCSASSARESVTLWDVYEPYLMQLGFVSRTPRGRCVTRLAYEHLGITPPPGSGIPGAAGTQISTFDVENE